MQHLEDTISRDSDEKLADNGDFESDKNGEVKQKVERRTRAKQKQ